MAMYHSDSGCRQAICDLNTWFEVDGSDPQNGRSEVTDEETAIGSEVSSASSPASTCGLSSLRPSKLTLGEPARLKSGRASWACVGRDPVRLESSQAPWACVGHTPPKCASRPFVSGPEPAFVPVPGIAERGTLDFERRSALKHMWENILRDDNYSTTLTVNNLPRSVAKTQLMSLVDATGFAGRYDYLYVPFNPKDGISRGHAYMNFHTHEGAVEFFQIWHGMRIRGHVVTVSVSTLQVFEASVGKWTRRKLSSMDPEVRPFIQGIA